MTLKFDQNLECGGNDNSRSLHVHRLWAPTPRRRAGCGPKSLPALQVCSNPKSCFASQTLNFGPLTLDFAFPTAYESGTALTGAVRLPPTETPLSVDCPSVLTQKTTIA